MKKRRRSAVWPVLICLLLLTAGVLLYSNFALTVSYYDAKFMSLPSQFNGYRIALLSDLHGRDWGGRLVDRIKAEKPDVIVMCGDMVGENDEDFSDLKKLSEELAEIAPSFFVTGNHETPLNYELRQHDGRRVSALNMLYASLKEAGVTPLINAPYVINRGDDSITLFGMETPQEFYFEDELTGEMLKGLFGQFKADGFTILLAHDPRPFAAYAQWGAELTLAGHMHGGVVRLPFIGGVLSPDRTLFPEYAGGQYEMNGKRMIVGRGLGQAGAPRFLNPSELCVITLVNG